MNNLRLVSYTLVVIMSAAVLAGCSTGGSSSVPTMSQTAASPRMQVVHSATARKNSTVAPDAALPCFGGGQFPVYGPATWWNESYSPTEWTEFTGYYTEANTNQGIIWYPCPGASSNPPCTPSPTCPGNTYNYHVQVDYSFVLKSGGSSCSPPCFLVAEASANQIALLSFAKKKPVQVGTFSGEYGSISYAPIGVAVANDGTIYASAVTVVGSGFGDSGVLVYAPGSSSPTSILSDKGLGQAAASIAIDKIGDVFLSYTTTTTGSQISAQIDEFTKGQTKSVPFATIDNAYDGGLAVTRKGEVVASTVSLDSSGGGQIVVLSAKGKVMSSFAVSGLPTTISLNKTNTQLWIDDAANDAISEYAFPKGGKPIVSGPLETTKGVPLIPSDFVPVLRKKR